MTRPRRRRPTAPLPTARPTAEPLEGRAYFTTGLTFAPVSSYAAGSFPSAIATGDLNGDGDPDVVVANFGVNNQSVTNGGISVLLGTGAATATGTNAFQPAQFYPVGIPLQSVVVADVNGDGLPDVVAVGSSANYAYVWLNTGVDGRLANPIGYAVGAHPEGVAVADVNGDGFPDIITANQGVAGTGSVSVLLGNVDPTTLKALGTFQAPVGYDGGPNPDAIAVGDLNQDGYPDIVTVDPENDELHVLLNRGTAATTGTDQFPATNTEYTTDQTGRAVAIVDTNNDARPDLVVANLHAANVGVLLNNGDGTFKDETTYGVGGFPFSVTSADLNGDNRAELITADSRDNAVGVLVHNGQGAYNSGGGTGPVNDGTSEPRQFVTGSSPEGVAAADLNGDGKPDLITADFNDSEIGVLMNHTVFTALTPTTTTLAVSQNPVAYRTPLTLTATVSPAPASIYPAGRAVQFIAGFQVLGVAKLRADGTATITTAKLPIGTSSITARFGGNDHYAGSVTAVQVVVQSDTDAAPLVAPTAVAFTSRAGRVGGGTATLPSYALPAAPTTLVTPTTSGPLITATAVALIAQSTTPLIPGDAAAVAVTLTNYGKARVPGYVAVALSLVSVADASIAIPLTAIGSATFGIDIRSGFSFNVPVRFRLPTDLPAGGYTIAATLTRARATFTTDQVSAAVATTDPATPLPVVSVLVPLTPGDTGTVAVTIANQGPGNATGSVAVALTITSATDPTVALAAAVVGTNAFPLNLIGGASRTVPVNFTVPASLAAGQYVVSAVLTPVATLTADQVVAAAATTASPTTVVTAFGVVPSGRRDVAVTADLLSGGAITLSLTGPGSGSLTQSTVTLNGVTAYRDDLTLTNTSAATTLSIALAGAVPVVLTTITDNYRLGTINAPGVTIAGNIAVGVTGALSLATGVNQVTLAGITDAGIGLGPRGHAALSLGTVANTALSAAAALQSLTVTSWTDTLGRTINAPGILGALTSAGDFGATLYLSGAALPVTLGSASIGGTLGSVTWLLGTGAGAISVGGNLDNDEIIAGARPVVGKDGLPAYVFNAARIAAVIVGGNVIGSFVAAGFRPTTDANPPFDPTGGTVIPGGSIGAITVTGTVDATSQFAAAALPTVG